MSGTFHVMSFPEINSTVNFRCGVVELRANSDYTNFCRCFKRTYFDILGIYYFRNKCNKLYFWDIYTGARIYPINNVSLDEISFYQDIVSMNMIPLFGFEEENINHYLFNILTDEINIKTSIEKLLNSDERLPGIKLLDDIVCYFGNRTEIFCQGEKNAKYEDKRLFDFSYEKSTLCDLLLSIKTEENRENHNSLLLQTSREITNEISSVNKKILNNEVININWVKLESLALKLSEILNIPFIKRNNKAGSKTGAITCVINTGVNIHDSIKFRNRIIPISNPDISDLDIREIFILAEYVQILIEQGAVQYQTLLLFLTNYIAIHK